MTTFYPTHCLILGSILATIARADNNPFPADSTGLFFPVNEGNIWILADKDPWDPSYGSIFSYVLEKGEVIDGKQYWELAE